MSCPIGVTPPPTAPYCKDWAKTLYPDMFAIDWGNPAKNCEIHKDPFGRSTCFRADVTDTYATRYGAMRLASKISIPSEFPNGGVLTQIRIDGLWTGAGAYTVLADQHYFKIFIDGAERWASTNILKGDNKWAPNPFNFNINIVGTELDIEVFKNVNIAISFPGAWLDTHTAGVDGSPIILSGYSFLSIPPPLATVITDIYDWEKRTGISGASVKVISSLGTLRGQGTTDANGHVEIPNVPEGIYTIRATASKYTTAEIPYSISAPETYVPAFYLEFVGGGFELPSWWWLIPIGIGGVAVTWLLVRTARPKRRATPPIIVLK